MLGVGFFTPFLLLAAFILLLLVSLSVPIIKSIYLISLTANIGGSSFLNTGVSGGIKFGVWGYCIENIKASVVGISQNQAGYCSKKALGYKVDSQLLDTIGLSNLDDILTHGLTFALVLHPIACGLAFVALLFSLFLLFRSARLASLFSLIFAILAAAVTTVAFAIDVAITAIAKNKIGKATDGQVKGQFGPAPWMTLGAMVALWAACVVACCGVVVGGRRRKTATTERY